MSNERLTPRILTSLALLPIDKPIVGLIRHAEREPFAPNDFGTAVNLTPQGQISCLSLAKELSKRLNKIYSSPVKRCIQTASLLAESAVNPHITTHHYLGDPGIFIQEPAITQAYFQQHSILDIVKHLLNPAANKPGFCDSTSAAVQRLIRFMLAKAVEPGIYLFITHDAILSTVLGYLYRETDIETLWPDYLEGLFIWQSLTSVYGLYRDVCMPLPWKTP